MAMTPSILVTILLAVRNISWGRQLVVERRLGRPLCSDFLVFQGQQLADIIFPRSNRSFPRRNQLTKENQLHNSQTHYAPKKLKTVKQMYDDYNWKVDSSILTTARLLLQQTFWNFLYTKNLILFSVPFYFWSNQDYQDWSNPTAC